MELKKEQIKEGKALLKKLSIEKVYVNESGEFFTSHNLVSLSVKNDKVKFAEITENTKEVEMPVKDGQTQEQKIELASKMVAGMRNKKAEISNDEIKEKLLKAKVDEEIIGIVLTSNDKN